MTSVCVCVECGARTTSELYEGYGSPRRSDQQPDTRNIRLTRCAVCDNLLDRYLEYDTVLVVVDLILHKVEVYRHLLFNSRTFSPWARRLTSNIAIFFFMMVLFDAHTKWRIDMVTQQMRNVMIESSVPGHFSGPLCDHGPCALLDGSGEQTSCLSAMTNAMSSQPSEIVLSPTGVLLYLNDKQRKSACGTADENPHSDFTAYPHSAPADRLECCVPASVEASVYEAEDNFEVDMNDGITFTHGASSSGTEPVPMVAVDMRQLPPALGGGCFNTSAEDAIIERWVDGMQDTKTWARGIRLLLLSFAENIVYITSVVCSIRLWQITCRRSSCAERCHESDDKNAETAAKVGQDKSEALKRVHLSPESDPPASNVIESLCSIWKLPEPQSLSQPSSHVPVLSISVIIRAIIISSWGKAILILLMIWDYANDMVHVVNLVAVASNVAAVHAILEHKRSPHFFISVILVLIPFGILTLVRMALAHIMGITVIYSTDWTPW